MAARALSHAHANTHTHGHARPHASTAPTAAPEPSTVPDIVEDRREDTSGAVVVRRYVRGRLLGKVRARKGRSVVGKLFSSNQRAQGGFAKCYKFTCIDKDNRVCACKVVDKTTLAKSKAKAKLLAEIRIHRSVSHAYIVGFESVFEDRANVYIMLEICPNQTMMELVKARQRLTEPEARYFSFQILDAMRYLHANNIIHRDLKLGNLLLSAEMEIKVGDFGLATQLSHQTERKRTICGTPNYIAPEILDNRFGHSFEVDVWAFGVILYTMLIGKPPFETSDVKTTYRRIRDNMYSFPDHAPISDEARGLITSILQTDPAARPTVEQILVHPFLAGAHAPVPRYMPIAALQSAPAFTAADIVPGAHLADRILQTPIAGLVSRASKTSSAPASVPFANLPPADGVVMGSLETVNDDTADTEGTSSLPGGAPSSFDGGEGRSSSAASAASGSYAWPAPSSRASSVSMVDKENAFPLAHKSATSVDAAPAHRRGSSVPRDSKHGSHPAPPPAVPLARAASAPSLPNEPAPQKPQIPTHSGARRVPVNAENPLAVPAAKAFSSAVAAASLSASSEGASGRAARRALAALTSGNQSAPDTGAHGSMTSLVKPSIVVPYDDQQGGVTPAATSSGPTPIGLPSSRADSATPSVWMDTHTPTEPRSVTVEMPLPLPVVAPLQVRPAEAALAVGAAAMPYPPAPSAPAPLHPREPSAQQASAALPRTSPPSQRTSSEAAMPDEVSPSQRARAPKLDDTLDAMHAQLSSPQSVRGGSVADVARAIGAMRMECSMTEDSAHSHRPAPGAPTAAQPWVSLWVDYTSKYGLGYMLSNGCIGVYFNDSTKIILASDGEHFQYIERASHGRPAATAAATDSATTTRGPDGFTRLCASISRHPSELKKKVTLLRHFTSYLHDQYEKRKALTQAGAPPVIPVLAGDAEVPGAPIPGAKPESSAYSTNGSAACCGMTLLLAEGEEDAMRAGCTDEALPFVKKWIRTKRSVLFRLSSHCVQVAFLDGTSVLLSQQGAVATYTDRTGRRVSVSPCAVMASHGHDARTADIAVRVRYVRDVLGQLVTQAHGHAAPAPAAAAALPPAAPPPHAHTHARAHSSVATRPAASPLSARATSAHADAYVSRGGLRGAHPTLAASSPSF